MEEVNTHVETSRTVDPMSGTVVKRQHVVRENGLPEDEFALAKFNQVIWYITHLIVILIVLRVLFYLLGANPQGIVSFIYSLTNLFVAPFRGIFPSPSESGSFFDTAGVVAIGFYYLLAFIVTSFLRILSKRNVEQI
ncbi:MAG TPA: YggT family protein [Candidatus Dojkabacteria bacterium]|nr:YggT family protein [Candidatus Dojkabacteria bacterium]HRP37185.1 YggT family protein [Candidatus Dojkabacteria bacterium]HRP51143.1 YggT family protein [Candidatus Dojkabacteria bacterium]